MDLEFREGIACMGLVFPSSLQLLFSWDTLTTFASHTSCIYDVLASVAPLKHRPSLLHTWAPPGGDLRVVRLLAILQFKF